MSSLKNFISAIGLFVFVALFFLSQQSLAADYVIDTKGAHAFVQFRTKHIGFSWLYGRFTDFQGEFSYDADKPEASKVAVTLKTASLASNHAERDKHLRSSDYLNVEKYPDASFTSSSFKASGENTYELKGKLTLFNTTKDITIDVVKIGEGPDPWNGYRVGFEGKTSIKPADFGVDMSPTVDTVELTLSIEGIRK